MAYGFDYYFSQQHARLDFQKAKLQCTCVVTGDIFSKFSGRKMRFE
jgi:hypothetical protein